MNDALITKISRYGNQAVKIALILVILSLTISAILMITFGGINEDTYHAWYSYVIWYSLIGSMWILICSPIYVVAVGVYLRYFKGQGLKSLKEHLILLLFAIGVSAAFIGVTLLVKK